MKLFGVHDLLKPSVDPTGLDKVPPEGLLLRLLTIAVIGLETVVDRIEGNERFGVVRQKRFVVTELLRNPNRLLSLFLDISGSG